jgi:hypothetical protein
VDAIARFSVSRFEATAGLAGGLWRGYIRGPQGKGLLLYREAPSIDSMARLKRRVSQIERAEKLIETNPRLERLVLSRPKARENRLAAYAEDLYALAARRFFEDPESKAVGEFCNKILSLKQSSVETRLAALALASLSEFQRGQSSAALSRIVEGAEKYAGSNLSAYLLFDAGEMARLTGDRALSHALFERALALRPGLTLARNRLP